MKALPLIAFGAGGLALGMYLAQANDALFTKNSSSVRRLLVEPTRGSGTTSAPLAGRDAREERVVRFFSALAEPTLLKKRSELYDALGELKADDLADVIKRVEAQPRGVGFQLYQELVNRWLQLDFAAATKWLHEHPRIYVPLASWAAANPKAAMAEALAHPDDSRSRELLVAAVEKLAGQDWAAKAQMIQQFPAGGIRDRSMAQLLDRWSKEEPARAIAFLDSVGERADRDSLRKTIMTEWAATDPTAALNQLSLLLPTLRASVLGNELINDVAGKIGGSDPAMVLKWLNDLPDELRIPGAISAAAEWVKKEPQAALDWCLANEIDVARGKRVGFNVWTAGVLGEALNSQTDAAIAWLEGLPDGPNRDRLLERGLADALWRAPKDRLFAPEDSLALRLLNDLPEDAQARKAGDISKEYVRQRGLTDLQSWAQNFASGPARESAVAGAIQAAYNRDASQVEKLLATISSDSDRDAALNGLAQAMAANAPEAAALRALSIKDSNTRFAALDNVAGTWAQQNTAAFKAWLEAQSTVPASWRRQLLEGR